MAAVRLRRIRLDGVGPPAARFDPITIDLRRAGSASPAALMFLENGGGKSILLRLIFSVVLAGRRNALGGANLADYVLSRDVSHVICEWEFDDGQLIPALLVTGKVMEWHSGHRSLNRDNLRESWYSFRPIPGTLDLDTLATRQDGRRVSRAGILNTLTEAQRTTPALDVVIEHSPGAWHEHLLKSTPLDPELFRYQRAMNVDESDADELFAKVTSGDKFVRFLLQAAADHDELREFGALLDAYIGQASNRDALEVQRAFAEAALGVLALLAQTEEERGQAVEGLTLVERDADLFARSLFAEVLRAEKEVMTQDAKASAAKKQAEQAGAESNRFESYARELRRRAALFDLADAEALIDDARAARERAEIEFEAWRAVPIIGAARRASARRREFAAAVERAAGEEAPYRRARDQAAADLRAAVALESARLEERGRAAADEADQLSSAAEKLNQKAMAIATKAVGADAEVRQLEQLIADVESERRQLEADGVAGPNESGETAQARHVQAATTASERLTSIAARQSAIADRRRTLHTRMRELSDRLVEDDANLRAIDGELERVRDQAREVFAHPRVAGLVGEAGNLWAAAASLRTGLEEAVTDAETRIRKLGVAILEDEQDLEALALDGRLPAAADVRAVLDTLLTANVPATTGWSWLSQLDSEGRARALATNPALAGGVIITHPAELERAREIVATAGLDARSVVVVGPAVDLERPSATKDSFAVPPNPALYDDGVMSVEHERLQRQVETVRNERTQLEEAVALDRSLLSWIGEILRRWPADAVNGLESESGELRERVEGQRIDRNGLNAEESLLENEAVALEAETTRLRDCQHVAAAAAKEAARLVGREAAVRAARERVPQLAVLAASWREEAARARQDEEIARRDSMEKRNEAGELGRHRRDLGRLLDGVPHVDVRPVVEGAVDQVRARFDAAAAALAAVAAGDEPQENLHKAEREEATALEQLADIGNEIIEAGDRLASTGAAATRASLDEATRSAKSALGRVREEETAASNIVTQAARDVKEASRPDDDAGHAWADLPDEWTPSDASSARRMREDTAERQRLARSRQVTADTERQRAAAAAETTRTRGKILRAYASSLRRTEPESSELVGVIPWSATTETAQERTDELVKARNDAVESVDTARQQLAKAHQAVQRVAADERFIALGGVRQAMAIESVDSLAGRARHLVAEVRIRLASIKAELEEVNKHREGVIERLSILVEEQLELVSLARRFSRIPAGLGEWSGQHFCRIEFHKPERTQLTARVASIVDAVTARSTSDPLQVLLDAVVAAVTRRTAHGDESFEVRLLKPNKAMFVDLVDVSRLGEEYSGGQRLTTAIMLYCTLAAVRTHARGGGDAGVLFLDNPIGKASADYLLDLQIAVAAKFGVQLVYTTGLFDPEVYQTFDCIVRLRNDADLRRHLNYIVLDEATQQAVLEGRDPGDRNGYIGGVRLSLGPAPQS